MEYPIELDDDGYDEEDEVQSLEVLFGRQLKKLTQVPLGKVLAEHIRYFKECQLCWEAYSKSMPYFQKIVDQILSHLELEGRCVELMGYATKDNVQIFLDILSGFNPDFSVNYRTKSQLHKMPIIRSLLTFP